MRNLETGTSRGDIVIARAATIKDAIVAADVDLADLLTLLAMQRVIAELYLSRGEVDDKRVNADFRKQLGRLLEDHDREDGYAQP